MKLLPMTCAMLLTMSVCAQAGEALTKAELLAAFPGHSGKWHSVDGSMKGTVKWFKDGRQTMTSNDPKAAKDTGRWRILNGQWCTRWSKAFGGRERCGVTRREGPNTYSTGPFITKVY